MSTITKVLLFLLGVFLGACLAWLPELLAQTEEEKYCSEFSDCKCRWDGKWLVVDCDEVAKKDELVLYNG